MTPAVGEELMNLVSGTAPCSEPPVTCPRFSGHFGWGGIKSAAGRRAERSSGSGWCSRECGTESFASARWCTVRMITIAPAPHRPHAAPHPTRWR
jgi:hypothetical protein